MLEAVSWLELESAADALAAITGRMGNRVDIDVREVINHRGMEPRGAVSANGSCRLLPTKDGWIAISLNRPDDWELLPALFGSDAEPWGWDTVAETVATMASSDVEAAATELGIALAVLPSEPPRVDRPWRVTPAGSGFARHRALRVVDLSALWAGPLCASLLHLAGADVLTIESTARPDSPREYPAPSLVSLDFASADGRAELRRLVAEADVVISASRLRALHNIGLDPMAITQSTPGLTWIGITAYGLTGPMSNRIGYGDDTAVAGGLVAREPTPGFLGDAIADPITGLYATLAGLDVLAAGGGVVDIALRDAAAYVARVAQ